MPPLSLKWRYCCSLLLIFFIIPVYAQVNIEGKVVDEKDDSPLTGVSVYFNNTTMGTYTNQQGYFQFEAIRLLGTDLVVYCPGYEIIVFKPTAEQLQGKKFIFKLRLNELRENNKKVVNDDIRKGWLAVFKENFLGITEEASKSVILNESTIYFDQGESKTSLTAFADTPLVIINNMMGYKISFNLVEFWLDEATGQNYIFGFSRYEEIDKSKKSIKNRQHSYKGSTLHFFRSLFAHQLYEQGFGTFLIKPLKDTVVAGLPAGAAEIPALAGMMAVPITAHEILYIDSTNNFSISFAGQLLVQYEKDPAAKAFLMQNALIAGFPLMGVESYISFNAPSLGINQSGALSDSTKIAYSGYWMYERAANVLPFDYFPE